MFKRVALIGVIVKDLKKAKEFYQNLGYSVDMELDLPQIQIKNAFVSFEGTAIELIEAYPGATLPYNTDGVTNHLTYEVENTIEETMEKLISLGAEKITEVDAATVENVGTVRFAFVKGINGEIIELWEKR